ncbi:alpha/beta fold hydrolase [Nocardia stercoris]|uniref:Alpha/beta hydrolase n=1 Tax=Nocardia stercoris TaxID=2483361 RepID=A0A3M2L3C6_9NOCA|nr:alpha/beta hydrolase [Nocardia stercoris]RMI32147.1 alpha/beta hydrolase [Nocardia stercoris]
MRTEFVDVDGGRIAYDVQGEGPLVVLSHGMGDHRNAFRHLAPLLARAGYRVASVDIRGHGESSMNWTSHDGSTAISRTDVGGDLVAVVRHLGGPAVIVGHSLSGGAATVAAATAPDLISAVVEIDPFTKKQSLAFGALFTNSRYRRGLIRLATTGMFSSLSEWFKYLDIAYPLRPADHDEAMAALSAVLTEPGRMAEFMKTTKSTPADAHEHLPGVKCPALLVFGTADPDWADPLAEAEAIAALMQPGLATIELIDGSGHYPHADSADRVAAVVIPFLRKHLR